GLPFIEETTRQTDSIGFYMEVLAALLAQRLGNTTLLVESSESFVDTARRAGRHKEGFTYDLFIDASDDLSNTLRDLHRVLEAQGYKVFADTTETERDSPGPKAFEALDSSRHGVFLLGKRRSARIDDELRRLARQLVEDAGERSVLPISFYLERSQDIPSILLGSEVSVEPGSSAEDLAELIRKYAAERSPDIESRRALVV